MIRQCCVCKRIYHDGKWVHAHSKDLEFEEITHSYCDICHEDFMRTVAEYAATLRPEPALATV